MHTFTGMMLAILAYSIINSLNDNTEGLKLSPFFVAIFAICFTVTIGVLWEVVEFSLDALTGSNMQRYMNSITLEPFSGREALKDTMKDLILDTVGAVIIATIGYFVMKKKEKAFSSLVIKKINDSEKKKGEGSETGIFQAVLWLLTKIFCRFMAKQPPCRLSMPCLHKHWRNLL